MAPRRRATWNLAALGQGLAALGQGLAALGRSLAALGLILAAAAGCGLTDFAGVTTPEPPAEAPGSNAAALSLPPTEEVVSAVGRAGAGLRLSGHRSGLRLRHAALSPESAGALLADLGVSEAAFGAVEPLRIGELTVLETAREDSSATVHLEPTGVGDEIRALSVGVVAVPPDRTLVPVIRGTVELTGSGYLLLIGDIEGRVLFATLVRTRIEGREITSGVRTITSHHLTVEEFRVTDAVLSRTLEGMRLPERGGEGGLATYRLTRAQADSVRTTLGELGEGSRPPRLQVSPDRSYPLPTKGLRLTARVAFSSLEFTYVTRVDLGDGLDRTTTSTEHADRETVLVLVWGADGPGDSRAVLLDLSPIE